MTPPKAVITAAVLLSVAALGWLIMERPDKSGPVSSGNHAVSLEVRIKHVEVRRTGDHAQLILTAVFDQSGRTPIRLEPPLVSLLTARQTPVARFIGPMLPEPVLTGEESTEVTLHYWLPLPDLNAPLLLEASGRRYPVKFPAVL